MFRSDLRLFATIPSQSKRSWITWLRWRKKYLQRWESRALSVFAFQGVVWNRRSSLPLVEDYYKWRHQLPSRPPKADKHRCIKTWAAWHRPTCLLYRSSVGHRSSKKSMSRISFTECLRITPKWAIRAQQTIRQLLKVPLVFLFQKYLEWDLWIFLWCVKCYCLRMPTDLPPGSICHSYTLLRSTYIGWGPKGKQQL